MLQLDVIDKRFIDKETFLNVLSIFAGLIFFFGLFVYVIAFFSFSVLIEQLTKITSQSNLLAFIAASWYFLNPTHRIFKTNIFLIFPAVLIGCAGLGFWGILFPVYWIDLGGLFISSNDMRWVNFSSFFMFWNHTVTPICFIAFFCQVIKKNNSHKLTPVNVKSLLFIVYCYFCVWVIWNMFLSSLDNVSPTYGIFTNFNPYKSFKDVYMLDNLFSIRALIFSHVLFISTFFFLSVQLSSAAVKYREINHLNKTGNLIRNSCVSIFGIA